LKDDLQPASANSLADQLIPITVGLVASNLKVGEETLDGFLEYDAVNPQLVVFKVIFEIGGSELALIWHDVSPEQIITQAKMKPLLSSWKSVLAGATRRIRIRVKSAGKSMRGGGIFAKHPEA
jgi:hypothetical protein